MDNQSDIDPVFRSTIPQPNLGRRRRGGGNLPHGLTSFVDRRSDFAHVKHLLSGSRLVTLTGVGGVGKTRLAVYVADKVRSAFADGV